MGLGATPPTGINAGNTVVFQSVLNQEIRIQTVGPMRKTRGRPRAIWDSKARRKTDTNAKDGTSNRRTHQKFSRRQTICTTISAEIQAWSASILIGRKTDNQHSTCLNFVKVWQATIRQRSRRSLVLHNG